ncbi:dihydrodipicolinate synthase family protein [Actinotalea sp. K2]|uniref:dihydrodipicolinate synthase family protein n=1 Tax=Actinotalea sp. K2 TaxID=2939438 RepID=UPI002016DC1F|nr:dihydrodipicolinate synthase family protein [Actinotalea sp. K2]MCL3861207.1 dihydrodipicolinate synthase family protein [Actinotalea sp. K2]
MKLLPDGAWPVMLTPFHEDLSVDWEALDAYTDWLVELGSAGLFAVALSGEMFDLTEDERLAIVRRVVDQVDGRVPVVASIVAEGPPDSHARAASRLADTGVDAVVLIASLLLAEDAGEGALHTSIEHILEANPGVMFGIYECPLPYHRILTTDTVAWIAQSGRFLFFKETSHDVAVMAERVQASSGTPMKVFNAGIENLVESLAVGVAGLSGWVVNVYPDLVASLCSLAGGLHGPQARVLQDALDGAERQMADTYPNSAKYLVARRSAVPMLPVSRWRSTALDSTALDAVATAMAELGEGIRSDEQVR